MFSYSVIFIDESCRKNPLIVTVVSKTLIFKAHEKATTLMLSFRKYTECTTLESIVLLNSSF